MSKEYLEKFGNKKIARDQMRKFCQRPGRKDKAGNNIYTTEQSHKNECDVNMIIRKYDKTGLITHTQEFEAKFGDMRGDDYKTMLDKVVAAREKFDGLPSHVRDRFENSPEKFLRFFEDENNREEAIKLGLIEASTDPSRDGIGTNVDGRLEHVTDPDPSPNSAEA